MSERIRWERTKYGGWTGHVGTLETWLFQIHKPVLAGQGWVLTATFPGALGDVRPGAPDILKAEAERWLEEFVTSLGAVFPDEPGESEAFQLSQARNVLTLWDAEQDGEPVISREKVLADQVRALLAIVDQSSAPGGAGTKE